MGCAAVAALSIGVWHRPLGLVAALGVGALSLGLTRHSRSLLGGALAALVAAAVGAAVAGVPTEPVLLATVAGVVAWDAAERAITLGEQIGRGADTARIERLHAASSALVGVSTAGIGYLIATGLSVSVPLTSILLLSGSVLVVLYACRPGM